MPSAITSRIKRERNYTLLYLLLFVLWLSFRIFVYFRYGDWDTTPFYIPIVAGMGFLFHYGRLAEAKRQMKQDSNATSARPDGTKE